ncbi:MAG: cardiolipin synthase [Verrucomicrobiota bacterium]
MSHGIPFKTRIHTLAAWLGKRRKRIIAGFVILAHIAGFLTSVRATMDVRTAQGAVAWVVSLNTMPYVAVPAYWVFGRDRFQGYVKARQKGIEKISPVAAGYFRELKEQGLQVKRDDGQPWVVEKLARLPVTAGNDGRLLIDGDETFESIFEGISRAKDYVLVQFYIIHDDSVGRELKQRLLERAAAGVRCHLIYDDIGSSDLPDRYVKELVAGGVEVVPFNTTRGKGNRFQINFRNHRKIVITDGREAWVGGLNIGDEYKGIVKKFGYWRDTHLWLSGPIVQCIQVPFIEDWHWASGKVLQGLNWKPEPALTGTSRDAFCLPTGPVDSMESCTLFFLDAIHQARERLWIASPYFVPDIQFVSALQLAALRGVDVRILIPDHTDNALVQFSGWSYIDELEKAGVKVFRYTKGFLHQKVMVVDADKCTVGTANFDNRSFRLNFEMTIAFHDKDFTAKVAEMLETDFSNSREMKAGELAAKGFWFRLAVRAARLTAPIQ